MELICVAILMGGSRSMIDNGDALNEFEDQQNPPIYLSYLIFI